MLAIYNASFNYNRIVAIYNASFNYNRIVAIYNASFNYNLGKDKHKVDQTISDGRNRMKQLRESQMMPRDLTEPQVAMVAS
jgi:hypothetical protein